MFEVPVLTMCFTRIDTMKQVFNQIKKIQPKTLYIAADGPRIDYPDDKEKCEILRKWIIDSIDWDCKVHTLFREKNEGCQTALVNAINWFFDNEEYGIILEDDCVPSLSFFSYCEELLKYYKNDKRVMHIAGYNCAGRMKFSGNASYNFGAIQPVWGWASWADRWQKYNKIIDKSEVDNLISHPYFSKKYRQNFWFKLFKTTDFLKLAAWDYQWTYCILKNSGYCAVPFKNLIQNIGFGSDSSHFENDSGDAYLLPTYEIDHIIHPKKVEFNWKLINYTDQKVFGIPHQLFDKKAKIYWTKKILFFIPKLILKVLGLRK